MKKAEDTVNALIKEIRETVNTISENSPMIKNDGSPEDISLIISLAFEIMYVICLVNNLTSLLSSITESLLPMKKKYILIAKTMEEKINWFLDNKIYESRSPFDPDFDTLMKQEIGVFKLEK